MAALDRTVPPVAAPLEDFAGPEAAQVALPNGRHHFLFEPPGAEVFRLTAIIGQGQGQHSRPWLPQLCATMLREGTATKSSGQLAELFDFHAAHLELVAGHDHTLLSISGIADHAAELVPLFHELLHRAAFPEEEWHRVQKNQLQRLAQNQQKTGYLASARSKELLFGEKHPYGLRLQAEHLQAVGRQDLLEAHALWRDSTYDLLTVAAPEAGLQPLVADAFGQDQVQRDLDQPSFPLEEFRPVEEYHAIEGKMQTSLRMVRRLPGPDHADFLPLQMLNMVFGGYFGSRLMKNIREDKGYTYGIYSLFGKRRLTRTWTIAGDVMKDKRQEAVAEVHAEMDRLCTALVGHDELETVKNYMLGELQASMANPFQAAENWLSLHNSGLAPDYWQRYVQTIRQATPEQLTELAQRYLQPQQWATVLVG